MTLWDLFALLGMGVCAGSGVALLVALWSVVAR